MESKQARPVTVRAVAIFLWVSYLVGAPAAAFLEASKHVLSQRFEMSPAIIFAACAVQFICAVAILARRGTSAAAALLTITTVGAIGAHLRIGSPETALVAVAYSAIQVWFAFATRRSTANSDRDTTDVTTD